ncbi:hypothetical protein CGRA01v4_07882 [Colletotrichum graminicola]|nr:hypothetical protein CGRA01v4_07882 [Colletotrichum graminicola]
MDCGLVATRRRTSRTLARFQAPQHRPTSSGTRRSTRSFVGRVIRRLVHP